MKCIQLVCLVVTIIALGGLDSDYEAQRSGEAVTDRTSRQMTIILACGVIAGGAEVLRRYRRSKKVKISIDQNSVIDGNPDRHSGLRRA